MLSTIFISQSPANTPPQYLFALNLKMSNTAEQSSPSEIGTTAPQPPPPGSKAVFVTTGATFPFPALIDACLTSNFLSTLSKHQYTHLVLQTQEINQEKNPLPPVLATVEESPERHGLQIMHFPLTPSLLPWVHSASLIVSHAGAGSILDALRYDKQLIVVPNPELMDGHQDELANELGKMGYCVVGKLGRMEEAVEEVARGGGKVHRGTAWKGENYDPKVDDQGRTYKRGDIGEVLEVEMGLMGLD